MQTVLIIIHLLIAIALIFVVLLQRSEGGALGIGGSGSGLGGLFSPRGAASTLTKTTAVLGILFFTTSMALTLLSLGARAPTSILNQPLPGAPAGAPAGVPPGLPTLPSANPPAAPGAPAPAPAPAAPQLPSLPPAQ
jgi:preprotein translocase subunit SecG